MANPQPSKANHRAGCFASRASLGSLAGQNVKFRWHIATDKQFGDLGWFLDDVAIYTCS